MPVLKFFEFLEFLERDLRGPLRGVFPPENARFQAQEFEHVGVAYRQCWQRTARIALYQFNQFSGFE